MKVHSKVLERATALRNAGRDIINLGIGQPDFLTPPHINEAAIRAIRDGQHGYTSTNGIIDLREAISKDIYSRFNVNVSPDLIIITPGGKLHNIYGYFNVRKTGCRNNLSRSRFPDL